MYSEHCYNYDLQYILFRNTSAQLMAYGSQFSLNNENFRENL